MKSLLLIITIVLLASCGNQKIRFRRVHSVKQEVVKVDDETRASIRSQKHSVSPKEEAVAEVITPKNENTTDDELKTPIGEVKESQTEIATPTAKNQTSNDDEKIAIALEAEKNASRAAGLSIGALIGYFALIIPGIVLTIFAGIYYYRARNAQYISEKGQKRMEMAKVFFIVDMVLGCAIVVGTIGIIINNFI